MLKPRKKGFRIPPPPVRDDSNASFGLLCIAIAAGFAMPFLMLIESRHPVSSGGQILISTFLYCLFWFGSLSFSQMLVESDDSQLFGFMPLTPRQYYMGNLRRIRFNLIVALVIAPVLAGLGLYLIPEIRKALSIAELAGLTVLQMIVLWLAFLVPLFENLTGKIWTGFYFFPRLIIYILILFPLVSTGVAFCLLATIFTISNSTEWSQTVTSLIANYYQMASPWGQCILMLASPPTAFMELFKYTNYQLAPLWWVYVWLISFTGFLAWRIWKTADRPIQGIEENIYSTWVANRSEYEQVQHYNAWFRQLYTESQLPQNIINDEDEYVNSTRSGITTLPNEVESLEHIDTNAQPPEDSPSPCEGMIYQEFASLSFPTENTILTYEEKLSAEVQAVRHYRFWVQPKEHKFPYLVKVLSIITLSGWLIGTILRTSFFSNLTLDILYQLFVVMLLWVTGFIISMDFPQRLAWISIHFAIYPLRFRKLRNEAVTKSDIINWATIDLGMATAVVLALELPWSSWIVCWGVLALPRFEMYSSPFNLVNLQPAFSKLESSFRSSPVLLAIQLPFILGMASFFFNPALNTEGRYLVWGKTISVHEDFVPGMFDLRIGGIALLGTAVVNVALWGFFNWRRRKQGDQCVTLPNYIPPILQPPK